jgi:hypothetical protein
MKLRHYLPFLAAALLCGCIEVEDELTLQPDGSGTVRLQVKANVPDEMGEMLDLGGGGYLGGGRNGGYNYPPTSEAEAKKWFPAKDFTLKAERKGEGGGRTLVIEAAFKDINQLLASPYGRAHQLALKLDGGALKLRALNGGETVARMANAKAEGEMAEFMPQGSEELTKKKGEMKFKFRVVLPNAVAEASGAKDGKAVTWAVARPDCKDDEEFTTKLAAVLTASCPADGVKFVPVTPPRLTLGTFAEIEAGKFAGTTPVPDTNAVLAAAKFVPYSLRVQRAVDLSGEGHEQSQAQLNGVVIVPAAFAPAQWGQAKLTEALDAKGKSLVPKEDEDGMSFSRRYSHMSYGEGDEDEDEDAPDKAKPADEVKRDVTLTFLAPDWKVKSLKSVKATVPMQYLAGSEVVKLSNAVPANLVMDMTKQRSFTYSGGDERGAIEHPRLAELGISAKVQMAMAQGSVTTVSLEFSGGKLALVDAAVYDADGRAWTTTFTAPDSSDEDDARSVQLMVAGAPKAPFSLALVWGGIGATVQVPVQLENVPLTAK